MQARYYDPVIGRLYSNDPVGFRGIHTFNRYSYVANNPYKYIDPSGMCAEYPAKDPDTVCQDNDELETGEEGKELIRKHEGEVLEVYEDTAKHNTVGVGHKVLTTDNLKLGDKITQQQSNDFFDADLDTAEGLLKSLVGDLRLSQNEFDALVDLTYNVGFGNLKNKSPSLNAAFVNKDYKEMGKQLIYTKDSKGNRQGGLINRSQARTELFNR